MFQKGELVVYRNKGVCVVSDISTIELSSADREKLFYVLRPLNGAEGKIFTPVESDKAGMRRILTKEEARELIENIPDMEDIRISDERQREAQYKLAVNSCNCQEWARMIKTLRRRNRERSMQGKRETTMDKKYFKMAADNLYAELAASLGESREKVKGHIEMLT